MSAAKDSDNNLITAYFKGEEKSLEILIQRYLKPIYSFVFRYIGNSKEAEDITQEVFVRVWKNLKKFDQSKNLAPHRTYSGAGFKTWIFAIAKNAGIDWLRRKKAVLFSELENEAGENKFIETLADKSPLPDEIFWRANIKETVQTALAQLKPQYRLVLFLRYNDHFTFREISQALEEPLNTVKSRHGRALVMMKKLLKNF